MPTDSQTRPRPTLARVRPSTVDQDGRPESRKQALISAAIALFASRPYRDVSVDEIVERAGVAHGMVSYHFTGKRGLFTATVAYVWDDLVEFERRSREETQPDAAVRGYLRRHFEYVRRYPDRFAILAQAASQDNDEIKQILEEARVTHLAELISVIGCRSQLPAELFPAMRGWNAFVEQVTAEWSRGQLHDAETLVELCLQVLVTSISTIDGFRFDQQTQVRALRRVTDTLRDEPA